MKLYVANISFLAKEVDLEEFLTKYTEVGSVKILYDKMGRSRGFGFIDVPDEDHKNVIETLNGFSFMGRRLVVAIAKSKGNPY